MLFQPSIQVLMRLCEAVLIIRTWAVWRRAQILGCVLFACFGAVTISAIVLVAKLVDDIASPCFSYFIPCTTNRFAVLSPPYLGFHGCYGTGGNPGSDMGAITYLTVIALDAGTTTLSGLDF
jgi:hypothetical protein